MPSYGCMHDVGDEDCAKCILHGILLNDCPYMCEDYEDINGNHPHREYWEQERRKYMPEKGENDGEEQQGRASRKGPDV